MIPFIDIIFYVFAAITVISATMVVCVRNPVYGALFLVLAFVASSGIWLLNQAEFLALALILVYVGAVMTLFLFVVMMLNIHIETGKRKLVRYFPIGLAIVGLIIAGFLMILKQTHFGGATGGAVSTGSNVAALGHVLYTKYVIPFELAAMLLLAAIVAAIALALPAERNRKMQDPGKQVQVKKGDRLKIIKM